MRPTKISLGIRTIWSESSQSEWKKLVSFSYLLSGQQRLWSDWEDAQADLSLRWAHMPFCWFCREAAQIRRWSSLQILLSSLVWLIFHLVINLRRTMTKPTKSHLRPTNTQTRSGYPPSLIRVFAHGGRSKVSSCGQRRLWSDWADAQADIGLPWAHKSNC